MVKELVSVLQGNPENIFFSGASLQEIEGLEHDLGVKLPLSYREFLSLTNGALLYQTGELLGTQDDPTGVQTSIVSVRKNNPDLPSYLVPFCLDGDISCFRADQEQVGELAVVRWVPKTTTPVQTSPNFPAWLSEYISSHF